VKGWDPQHKKAKDLAPGQSDEDPVTAAPGKVKMQDIHTP